MRVPSGAYRPPTQSGEIERNRQKIDVLSRRQQRLPKIPPPVAAAGGGIVGMSLIYLDNFTVGGPGPVWAFAGSTMEIMPYSGTGAAPPAVSGLSDEGYGTFGIGEAGLYGFRLVTKLSLYKTGGTATSCWIRLERTTVWNDHERIVPMVDGAQTAYRASGDDTWATADDWTVGPQYESGSDSVLPIARILTPSTPSLARGSFVVEVTRFG